MSGVRMGTSIGWLGARFRTFVPEDAGDHGLVRDSPERRLLLAVLTDALHVYERCGERGGAEDGRRALEVERWIASEATESPFAYARVCEALEIDPGPIRRHVRRLRLARLAAAQRGTGAEDRNAGRTR